PQPSSEAPPSRLAPRDWLRLARRPSRQPDGAGGGLRGPGGRLVLRSVRIGLRAPGTRRWSRRAHALPDRRTPPGNRSGDDPGPRRRLALAPAIAQALRAGGARPLIEARKPKAPGAPSDRGTRAGRRERPRRAASLPRLA